MVKLGENLGEKFARKGDAKQPPTATEKPVAKIEEEEERPSYYGLTGNSLIWAITGAATFGFLLFGYDQGVMSGLLTGRQFQATFPACDAAVQGEYRASLLQAIYTAIYELGCLAGAVFAFFFGEKLGRRRMMQSGAIIVIVGTIIQATAFRGHHAGVQFLFGRVITGIGVGKETATIPSWQAETSRAHNRGLLICIEASMVAIGTAIAYWIDFGMSYVDSSAAWRVPIALQALFGIALLFVLSGLPESPRWLAANNQTIEAQRVVAALASQPLRHPDVVQQMKIMQDALARTKEESSAKLSDVFKGGPGQYRRRALLGMSSQIMQQIGGCNAVIYFSPIIFQQNLGLDRTLSLILGGAVVSCYAIAACGSYFSIESFGRRKMFLTGSGGQATAMFIVMGCLIPNTKSAANGSVFGLFLYLIFFGATWLELPWLYPAELNPMKTRSTANALSTCCNWLFNFTIVLITPPMLSSIGWGTFLFFGVLNVLFIPFIYFFYPETAGRTLEELDVVFAKAYIKNDSYVDVSKTMPKLLPEELAHEAEQLRVEHETQQGQSANSSRTTLVGEQ